MNALYKPLARTLRTLWLISPMVLIALLALVLTRQAPPAGAAARSAMGNAAVPPIKLLASFPATGLPSGPARITAQVVHLPAGLRFKHVHGVNGYNYIIAGAVTSIDDGVTRTYHAGQFFWEPGGHVHTVITTQPATFFSLVILTPHAAATIPVQ
jgi:quercetin dioxygenase-like cupin family protein